MHEKTCVIPIFEHHFAPYKLFNYAEVHENKMKIKLSLSQNIHQTLSQQVDCKNTKNTKNYVSKKEIINTDSKCT